MREFRLRTAELGHSVVACIYLLRQGIQRYSAVKEIRWKRRVILDSGRGGNPNVVRLDGAIGWPVTSRKKERIRAAVRQSGRREGRGDVVFRVRSEIVPVG